MLFFLCDKKNLKSWSQTKWKWMWKFLKNLRTVVWLLTREREAMQNHLLFLHSFVFFKKLQVVKYLTTHWMLLSCSSAKHLTLRCSNTAPRSPLMQYNCPEREGAFFRCDLQGCVSALSVQWWSWVPLIPAPKHPYQISTLHFPTLNYTEEFNTHESERLNNTTHAYEVHSESFFLSSLLVSSHTFQESTFLQINQRGWGNTKKKDRRESFYQAWLVSDSYG